MGKYSERMPDGRVRKKWEPIVERDLLLLLLDDQNARSSYVEVCVPNNKM